MVVEVGWLQGKIEIAAKHKKHLLCDSYKLRRRLRRARYSWWSELVDDTVVRCIESHPYQRGDQAQLMYHKMGKRELDVRRRITS